MIAVDTNVLVRTIVDDDPHQVDRARAFIAAQDRVLILRTVLLELAWVLGSRRYQLTRDKILSSLRTLARIPNVEIEDGDTVMQALEWYESGMDFADALHLASIGGETEFATFDASLRRAAQRLGIGRVVTI